MSAKSEAYKKDLGNKGYSHNYTKIQWNSSKKANRQENDAHKGVKNSVSDFKA